LVFVVAIGGYGDFGGMYVTEEHRVLKRNREENILVISLPDHVFAHRYLADQFEPDHALVRAQEPLDPEVVLDYVAAD
jgi:hypothetical protein